MAERMLFLEKLKKAASKKNETEHQLELSTNNEQEGTYNLYLLTVGFINIILNYFNY